MQPIGKLFVFLAVLSLLLLAGWAWVGRKGKAAATQAPPKVERTQPVPEGEVYPPEGALGSPDGGENDEKEAAPTSALVPTRQSYLPLEQLRVEQIVGIVFDGYRYTLKLSDGSARQLSKYELDRLSPEIRSRIQYQRGGARP